MRVQTILVAGGAGFIGSHLIDALVNNGCTVVVLDNLSSGSLTNIERHLKNGKVRMVKGDIVNIQLARESLKGIDAVFHLAGIVSVPYSVENPGVTNNVNVGGTRNLLEASVSNDLARFVNVSSSAVYGDAQYIPVDEDHPLNPMSPYAQSKLIAEKLCQEFHDKYGLKTVSLRLFNVYGPRQRANEYSGVITKFVSNIRKGKSPMIFGDGQQTRDFVHVSDAVRALLLTANSDCAVGETFNIGSGRAVTVNELCRLVLGKLKTNTEPVYEEPRAGEVKHSCARIEKACRMLGYEPKVSLEEGLESAFPQI